MAFYTVKTSAIVHDYIQAQMQGISETSQQCDNSSVLSDWVHLVTFTVTIQWHFQVNAI